MAFASKASRSQSRMGIVPKKSLRTKTFSKFYVFTLGFFVGLFVLVQTYNLVMPADITADDLSASRKLLSSGGEVIPGFNGNCPDMASWEEDSYGILHVIIVIYLFLGIAVICDEQFTSSLESICNPRTGLGLSPDVAGATFMAAGSSAPELASSCMGTFVSNSDVGLGTIIGSAVFNILIIIGATAIIVGEPMELDWKPLTRDTFFYCGSVTFLIIFVAGDQKIETYEAAILVVYYFCYILFMTRNTQIMRWVAKNVGADDEEDQVHNRGKMPGMSSGAFHHKPEESKEGSGAGSGSGYPVGSGTGEAVELPGTPTMGTVESKQVVPEDKPIPAAEPTPADKPSGDVEEGGEESKKEKKEDEEEEVGEWEAIGNWWCDVLSVPYIVAFDWTMPDCKYEDPDDEGADEEIEELEGKLENAATEGEKAEITEAIAKLNKQKELRGEIEDAEKAEDDDKVEKLEKELFALYEPLTWQQEAYLFTFFVSLIWITILSYFMVTLMEKIGCAWGISSFIMGITFLAMGTSVPDALGSIAVAREGEGDMAVSNAIGSNVFDICLGLGLPWLIATIIDDEARAIKAATESIIASTCILFSVVIVLFVSLYTSKSENGKRFCLYPGVGKILFGCYFLFVIFQIVWTAAGLPE